MGHAGRKGASHSPKTVLAEARELPDGAYRGHYGTRARERSCKERAASLSLLAEHHICHKEAGEDRRPRNRYDLEIFQTRYAHHEGNGSNPL